MLFHSFWHVIAPQAFWVNPMQAAKAANSKLLQLRLARKMGLKIPNTLVSNNPTEIKRFIQQQKEGAIYKTLFPTFWIGESDMRLTYTREISLQHLPDDAILQTTPGIFQNKINKAYELRITYFGDHAISVKIHSQDHPKGILDWRYIPTKELLIEECRIPDLIHQRCKELMKQLNLVFGCFDFIVTHDNEYYFLEVNEQGQFLWIEEINPDIPMLDTFTEFLLHQDRKFSGINRHKSVRMGDFIADAEEFKKSAMALHQDPGTFY
jgi:glutathione synthase/RimK-type ligase-like ATP-grasp enzyme